MLTFRLSNKLLLREEWGSFSIVLTLKNSLSLSMMEEWLTLSKTISHLQVVQYAPPQLVQRLAGGEIRAVLERAHRHDLCHRLHLHMSQRLDSKMF